MLGCLLVLLTLLCSAWSSALHNLLLLHQTALFSIPPTAYRLPPPIITRASQRPDSAAYLSRYSPSKTDLFPAYYFTILFFTLLPPLSSIQHNHNYSRLLQHIFRQHKIYLLLTSHPIPSSRCCYCYCTLHTHTHTHTHPILLIDCRPAFAHYRLIC